MTSRSLLGSLGRGLIAGAVGTLAMTASERLEMALSGREASQVPGQVGAHLVPGNDPESTADVKRLNSPVHWAHGVSMGTLRAALDVAGLRGPQASAVHFALLWGGDAALYRALGIADAPWQWDADELAVDLLHKVSTPRSPAPSTTHYRIKAGGVGGHSRAPATRCGR